jgi:hypothetical protein
MTSVSSPPSLIASAPTIIVCIRAPHLVHSDVPLWKFMPEGGRNEVGLKLGELAYFIMSMFYITKLLCCFELCLNS